MEPDVHSQPTLKDFFSPFVEVLTNPIIFQKDLSIVDIRAATIGTTYPLTIPSTSYTRQPPPLQEVHEENMGVLLDQFTVRDLVWVHLWMLMERPVIVCDDSLTRLSKTIFALSSLLVPFSWEQKSGDHQKCITLYPLCEIQADSTCFLLISIPSRYQHPTSSWMYPTSDPLLSFQKRRERRLAKK